MFDRLKHIWWEIEAWFCHHTSKGYRRLYREVLRSRPFDYSYLFELERVKLLEMADYIEKHKRCEEWQRTVRDMRICAKLIYILQHETDLFHFTGQLYFVETEDGSGLYEAKETPDYAYVCDVYVNTRNAYRFGIEKDDFMCRHAHEIYLMKARYLYHKIRFERELEWWD